MSFRLSTIVLIAAMLPPMAARAQDEAKPAEGEPASAAAPIVSAAEAKAAEELFADGRKLFFQGKYREAAGKLAQAVDANPEKTSYKLLLAKALRYADDEPKAAAVLQQVLKADPEHVEAGVQLAELLTPAKEPDRVIAVLEPLLKFKHDYPLYHLLAEAHYEKEQFDKARTYYEEAIKLNPENENDHYQLGNIYLAQQRFAKAAQAYEQAGRLGLSTGVYHFKLASVYFNLHNYLGRVSETEVKGGQPGEINGDVYLIDAAAGKPDVFYVAGPQSAIFQAAKAKQMGVDIFEIHLLTANIWLSARRYARADEIYAGLEEKAADHDPGLYWHYRAQAALGLGEYEQYLARVQKAIDANPDVYKPTLADAYVTVATRYHQQGDTEKYIEFLDKAVQTNPLSASLHLSLGDAHWLAGDRADAIAQYKLVLELEPEHGQRVRLLNRIRGRETAGG